MSVSNLTNTTWKLNYAIDYNYQASDYFHINFTSNNASFVQMLPSPTNEQMWYDPGGGANWVLTGEEASGGEYHGMIIPFEAYRTITITGGTDVTNQVWITWLEANAVQQLPTMTVDITTLDNYASLPSGTYTISAVAKGTGTYTSSNKSTGVSYTKAASGYQVTISFAQGDRVDGIYIYDGQDNTGTLLGYAEHMYNDPPASYTYSVSSGYMYFDPDTNWYNSVTYSENIINHSQGATTHSNGYGLFEILGDGTISNFDVACFAKGTQISLADGKTKNVEDITYNDLLLVWNFYEARLDVANPCWICKPGKVNFYWLVKLSDNTELKLVGKYGHRLFNVDKQQMLYCVDCVGNRVYKQDGSIVTVLSCEQVFEEVEYYNLTTDVHLDCFANEVLTGSRLNNMYKIEDMKYVDRNRLISVEEEQERWEYRWKHQRPKC